MNMIKTLVATALLSASFAANAAVTVVTTPTGFMASNTLGAISNGKFTDTFDFTFGSVSLADNWIQVLTGRKSGISDAKLTVSTQGQPDLFTSFNNDGADLAFTSFKANQKYTFTISGTKFGPSTAGWTLTSQVAPVPEPETYALMGMGLVGLLAARRRKAKQA